MKGRGRIHSLYDNLDSFLLSKLKWMISLSTLVSNYVLSTWNVITGGEKYNAIWIWIKLYNYK